MKTTPHDFALFESHVRKWTAKLGLAGWHISVLHEAIDGDTLANVASDACNGIACIRFNLAPTIAAHKFELERLAFHECFHLVTQPLTSAAARRYTTPSEIDHADHVIVRTVENLLFGVQ